MRDWAECSFVFFSAKDFHVKQPVILSWFYWVGSYLEKNSIAVILITLWFLFIKKLKSCLLEYSIVVKFLCYKQLGQKQHFLEIGIRSITRHWGKWELI